MAELGRFGIWARGNQLSPELAERLEQLGFDTIWIGGSPDGDLALVDQLLAATQKLTVATGIVNIFKDKAEPVAESFHRIQQRFGDRFLLGIGAGHPETAADYDKPYEALVHYLDVLDQAEVPVNSRVLAALGPKVLRLAAERTAGAHPYLTTPEHTARAREILGPDALLVPEQKVVLNPDPDAARRLGRPAVATPYLGLRNYLNNLRTLGFGDQDFADGGSDRLIDAVVVHGDLDTVAAGLRAHLQAGASQVAIQLIAGSDGERLSQYAELAQALLG